MVADCKPCFNKVIAVQSSREPPNFELCLHYVVEKHTVVGSCCSFHTLVVDNRISLVSKSYCHQSKD